MKSSMLASISYPFVKLYIPAPSTRSLSATLRSRTSRGENCCRVLHQLTS